MSRWSWILLWLIFVGLTPIGAFECVYEFELRASRPALAAAAATHAPALALGSLWLAEGERLDSDVRPLWAGNFFEAPAEDPRGSLAAYRIADARIARHGFERAVTWHLREAALAVWLTRHASVADLQRTLAAEIYMGRGARGFDAAAHAYFDSPASTLSVGQIAMLVGLAREPSIDPSCFPERTRKRRDFILRTLVRNRLISDQTFAEALREPVVVAPRWCPPSIGSLAPH